MDSYVPRPPTLSLFQNEILTLVRFYSVKQEYIILLRQEQKRVCEPSGAGGRNSLLKQSGVRSRPKRFVNYKKQIDFQIKQFQIKDKDKVNFN